MRPSWELPSPTCWIGGGSGAGKSTVARALAARHGLSLVSTDDVMADHARRCPPGDCPELARFATMTMDERWLDRSPAQMLDTFHWFRGEGFGPLLEDLAALQRAAPGRGVVVEGFRLLPALVAPLLPEAPEPARAVWLLPTPDSRRRALAARGSTWTIAGRTSDPPRALENLLERDRLFTERLREETAERGLVSLDVDGGAGAGTAPALIDTVERLLGLAP